MDEAGVRFDALRNAHYHRARQRALDAFNKAINSVIILLGATVASDFFEVAKHHERAIYLGLATTVVATIQLVYDPGGRARVHEFLQKRFYELLADIEEAESVDALKVKKWEAALTRMYADQPPTMRALDSVAYNETADSAGYTKEQRLHVTFFQNAFRHLFSYNNTFFYTEAEWKNRKTWCNRLRS